MPKAQFIQLTATLFFTLLYGLWSAFQCVLGGEGSSGKGQENLGKQFEKKSQVISLGMAISLRGHSKCVRNCSYTSAFKCLHL